MKKIIFLTGICLCFAFPALAQDDDDNEFQSARGIDYLPDDAEFAIGFDLSPVLNLIGGGGSNLGGGIDGRIFFKYFLDDEKALRAKLRVSSEYEATKYAVQNDQLVASDPLNVLATVVDVEHRSSTFVDLSLGIEFRRGSNRLQGFYGGELVLGYNSGNNYKYDFANPMTEVNQSPTSSSFFYAPLGGRATEYKEGKGFSVGLNLVLGAEYFIAPKLSIGGEFNLGFVTKLTEQNEVACERWNTSANKIEKYNYRSNAWTGQNMDLKTRSTSVIYMMFHF